VRRGWAPLAPALQAALDFAMASNEDRVELLIDPTSRAWLPNSPAIDEARRRSCAVYVALPKERRMGKVGGEAPRPIRWASAMLDEGASAGGAGSGYVVSGVAWPAAAGRAAEGGSGDGDGDVEDEDPLMFTAKPADGVVLHSSVFERLQLGVSERFAGYRYAAERCAPEIALETEEALAQEPLLASTASSAAGSSSILGSARLGEEPPQMVPGLLGRGFEDDEN